MTANFWKAFQQPLSHPQHKGKGQESDLYTQHWCSGCHNLQQGFSNKTWGSEEPVEFSIMSEVKVSLELWGNWLLGTTSKKVVWTSRSPAMRCITAWAVEANCTRQIGYAEQRVQRLGQVRGLPRLPWSPGGKRWFPGASQPHCPKSLYVCLSLPCFIACFMSWSSSTRLPSIFSCWLLLQEVQHLCFPSSWPSFGACHLPWWVACSSWLRIIWQPVPARCQPVCLAMAS